MQSTAHGFKPLQKSLDADYIATKKGRRGGNKNEPHCVRKDEKIRPAFLYVLSEVAILVYSVFQREHYHSLPLKASSVLK